MANTTTLPGDLVVPGNLRVAGSVSPLMAPSEVLAITALATFVEPMQGWRVHDAYNTELDGTPTTDDLGLIGGTLGSNVPTLQTDDFGGNAAAVSYYARKEIRLPWDYVAGSTVKIRIVAGMLTTVADQDATVDLEVYSSDEDSTSSADLASAAVANNMNSLTPFSDIDFTITATNLAPGDILDVRIHVSVDDNGDAGVMKGCIGAVQLLCDVR